MNSTCNGDFYTQINVYRCLYDGKIVKTETAPTQCPICNRLCNADVVDDAQFFISSITRIRVQWSPHHAIKLYETEEVESPIPADEVNTMLWMNPEIKKV